MITSRDVKLEVEQTQKVIEDSNATVVDKIKAVYKLLTVNIKIGLSNRRNTVKVMDKLQVEKEKPVTRTETAKTESDEKTETSK